MSTAPNPVAVFFLWDIEYLHPDRERGRTTLSVITKGRWPDSAVSQARMIVQTIPDAKGRVYPFLSDMLLGVRFAGTLRYIAEAGE